MSAAVSTGVALAQETELDPTPQPTRTSALLVADAIKKDEFDSADFLTGDWFGLRPQLVDAGISPFLFYDSISSANVSGGIRDDQAFTGQAYFGFDLDFEKLLGWDGLTMKISAVNRHGDTVSGSVGGIYDPQTIFGGQTTFLYQVFFEQEFNDMWSFKFGRVSADTDFTQSSLYAYSLSTAINGPIRATLLEDSITSFPNAVWGGRLKYKPNDVHQFQLGVYQTGDRQTDASLNGTDLSIRSGDGVSVLAQYDWTPKIYGRDSRFFVGAISSFRDFDNFDGESSTDFLFRTYAYGEIEVIDNLKVFATASYADQDEVAVTPLQINAGLNYKGLIPGRKDDRTFLFGTYGQLSNRFGDSLGEDVSNESVFELGHRFQLTPAAFVQPTVQYIARPGGTGNIDDAIVLGAWVGFAF